MVEAQNTMINQQPIRLSSTNAHRHNVFGNRLRECDNASSVLVGAYWDFVSSVALLL